MGTIDFIKAICLDVGSIAPLLHVELMTIPLQAIDRCIEDRKITR